MTATLEREEKNFKFEYGERLSITHTARIYFARTGKQWVFDRCIYRVEKESDTIRGEFYSFTDWKFLNELSAEIIRLEKELNCNQNAGHWVVKEGKP